ncbi:hypothetical protein EV215_0709 [Hypnocyclicus thermotrophus]|uniref:Uncharacterized protein n=1 Tax=Hypnocyclicus thermotrophus TaxID=1627895 RepID=A0AA46I6B1_9FUSO|nr:hypothetical protein [Hypnocyclicus thermotrophus]TDT72014.1 hypothetical protein EV215_0709 [Hypnocyclicus thermotrophus]
MNIIIILIVTLIIYFYIKSKLGQKILEDKLLKLLVFSTRIIINNEKTKNNIKFRQYIKKFAKKILVMDLLFLSHGKYENEINK